MQFYLIVPIIRTLFPHAGEIRTVDLSKREKCLDNGSVIYAESAEVPENLAYDFYYERQKTEKRKNDLQLFSLVKFISNLWQIHIFSEGNTRATAVFFIKYLKTLGFNVTNDIFAENAWYFRNALVRANYTNVKKSIYMNNIFLEKFFENLLLGKNNELKNRYTHIRYTENIEKTSVQNDKNFGTKEKTSVQIMDLMKENPSITLQQIAEKIGLSKRAIEMQVKKLREQGKVNRIGATKKGLWEVRG